MPLLVTMGCDGDSCTSRFGKCVTVTGKKAAVGVLADAARMVCCKCVGVGLSRCLFMRS